MAELRWILLGAGVALIIGLYLWGTRSRLRSAAIERTRSVTVPTTAGDGPGDADPERYEPEAHVEMPGHAMRPVAPDIDADEWDTVVEAGTGGRREPTLGERLTARTERVESFEPFDDPDRTERLERTARFERTERAERVERTERLEPTERFERTERAERRPSGTAEAPSPARDDESQTEVEARAQSIVALRVVAPLPSRFEGSLLADALAAEQFEFGRFQIFHRLDAAGQPLISLASLREPGTFDPATMSGAAYAGLVLFAVLPGPLSAQQAFEDLLVAARSLAGRLGGHVQDNRGVPLVAQRIARLREEMAAIDRAAGRR
ncbi:MAG: cell division protein ZipA C-terminal FtsZ-binding domain-containing protein [Steroidobacteraceae bacterium]